MPCLCRIFESENKELDIYEVWTPIHDEKSIKLPVWKEVGVTQALGLSLSLLAMPCFCAHLLPSLYLMLPFSLHLQHLSFMLYVVCGQVFHLGKGGKASYCIFIKHTCDFSLKLLEFFAFLQTFSFPHLHFVPPQCWGATNCTCGLGLCSFGDRWLWCAAKPKVEQKSNQLFTFYLCFQSIVVKSARVGVCLRGRGGVLQLSRDRALPAFPSSLPFSLPPLPHISFHPPVHGE